MARNRQPKTKLARKVGEAIFGYDKYFEKRQYKPGQHGPSKRRRTASEYATQLKEKQKAKLTYGLLERQFANLFDKANRKKGVTGENLLQLLELRLDNVVFRLGMARSRRQARQLVTHKHITLNGLVCNIPSATLRPGDIVSVRGKSKKLEIIEDSLSKKGTESAWLQMEESDLKGTVLQAPTREEIPENIKEQLIVELYSK